MNIGIIGTGAFAIALESILEEKNYNIMMWTKLEEEYIELTKNHTNLKVLNYQLSDKTKFTMNLEELSNHSNLLILAIPTKFLKNTIMELKKYYHNQEILIASKGMIETDTLLLNEFLESILKTDKISNISGPSFAIDVIEKQPIGLTISSNNQNSLNYITNIFQNINYLSIDKTNDIIGTEIWGITKNIIAIGSGILNGMDVNSSVISKYLKDSVTDIQSIIKNLGGSKKTFFTYAGLGDFILTTTNKNSRNYTFGFLIGSNSHYSKYLENHTIEGLENLNSMFNLLKVNNINSKIIDTLYQIIYLNQNKNNLIKCLKDKK